MCMTLMLTAALAGLPAGACAVSCQVQSNFVAAEHGEKGWAMDNKRITLADGTTVSPWFRVYRVAGQWRMILEQEPRQCR